MGKRKDKSHKSSSKKVKYEYEEEEATATLPLSSMLDTLLSMYPNDSDHLRNLFADLDDGCLVDIREIEDRSVRNLLEDMFNLHFQLLKDKETKEYYKSSSSSSSLVEIFDKYLQEHQSKHDSKPKSLLEAHMLEKANSKSEKERRDLERKGFLTWDRDRDIENPTTAVDKKRLLDVANNASKFSKKFTSRTETKFL
ncbi:hypothetical protein C9374_013355 [Naegleria lovaniensis]|uniref:Uncharacterized protein n=1 Tax=Naegleria lovaniensis TaxID=51637 RepID=A0AA88KVD4_NAELO|nr:uncharacterized protein C9374_013355 [Naegleria lovaniensis]KAG2391870.1 hypothetical protein C9374_013355 [Naegleria lovaniensis]